MSIKNILSVFTSICLTLSTSLGQELLHKTHAEQMAQFGTNQIDQEGGFVGFPRDLVETSSLRDPSHVVFGYHPYWNGTSYQNYVYDILSHIAWFGLNMNSSGNITASNGWPVNGLVDLAHSHGVKVIVTVTLFVNADIGTLVGNATNRQNAIDNLILRVNQGNADGVNIDFEFVPQSARSNFNIFIHDLTEAFHDQIPGSEVSIAMPSVDWSSAYDYNYLSDNCDGLMIMAYGYYWSGSENAGPISPLYSGLSSWHISRTIEDYLTKTGQDGSQLILGLPWYGRDWPVSGTSMNATTTGSGSAILYSAAEANAQAFGKNYNSTVVAPWYNYNSGGAHQVWYDDSLSLATKYSYAVSSDIKGVGIWALGYDGGRSEIWGGLNDVFGATAPPQSSAYFSVKNLGNGSVAVRCAPSAFTDRYEAHISLDGSIFTLADSSGTPDFTLDGLTNGDLVYIKTRNGNVNGTSNFSEVLAVVVSTEAQSSVLVVQGFERTSGTVNNFDYIIEHGSAIQANGRLFDAASNDAIEAGTIDLADYDIVDWICGEEATATVSFSPAEQTRIMEYLEQGGRIFISGSEIGYDLQASGSASDIAFFHNYFKADYLSDDTQSYSMNGMASGIFAGLSGLSFDDGSHGSYDVDYPDGIKPFGGSLNNLRYEGVNYDNLGGAGIQYMGGFGQSNALGGIVFLSVGFEAIYPESARNEIMARTLDYLEMSLSVDPKPLVPGNLEISAAYPNPFNSSFSFTVESQNSTSIEISIFNLKGQLIHKEQGDINRGNNRIHIRAFGNQNISSSIYVLQVENQNEIYTQNITFLK